MDLIIPLNKFSLIHVEDLTLWVPNVLAEKWPTLPLDEFPNFCGAGKGWKEKAVPDTMWNLSVRHNCFIHDICFTILPPRKVYWHLANYIMLVNDLETIRVRSNFLMRPLRSQRALSYFAGVETENFGYRAFVNREWIENYNPFEDKMFIEIMNKVGVRI